MNGGRKFESDVKSAAEHVLRDNELAAAAERLVEDQPEDEFETARRMPDRCWLGNLTQTTALHL